MQGPSIRRFEIGYVGLYLIGLGEGAENVARNLAEIMKPYLWMMERAVYALYERPSGLVVAEQPNRVLRIEHGFGDASYYLSIRGGSIHFFGRTVREEDGRRFVTVYEGADDPWHEMPEHMRSLIISVLHGDEAPPYSMN